MRKFRNHSPFFRVAPEAKALRVVNNGTDSTDLYLYDEISPWGIDAKTFVRDLAAIETDTVHLHVNSPGGDVFEGLAMANALRDHEAHVVTHIDGLAASIASIVALAGDEVHMAENAFLMIHEPWTFAMGNASELRQTAETLDKIGGSLVGEYMRRSGQPESQVRAWMADETWFDSTEAKQYGFIDAADPAVALKNEYDLSVFSRVPSALTQAPRNEKRDLERILRDAGHSRSEAKRIAALAASPAPREAEQDNGAEVLRLSERLLASLTSHQ